MYQFYLADLLLPVTPGEIDIKQRSDNKTVTLMTGEEIAILGKMKLAEIGFRFILPRHPQSYARYRGGFKSPEYFLERIGQMTKQISFKVIELGIDRLVTIEDYQIKEKAAGDIEVRIKLKDFRTAGTKTYRPFGVQSAVVEEKKRPASINAPAPTDRPKRYTVKAGDTLWAIAKKFYGDGEKFPVIAKASGIKNPNLIYPGDTLTIPVV